MSWQLQDAKSHFSEVVEEALLHGPQTVTKRGVETVVVVSVEDYRKLLGTKTPLVDFFKSSPLAKARLDLKRDQDSSVRNVSL